MGRIIKTAVVCLLLFTMVCGCKQQHSDSNDKFNSEHKASFVQKDEDIQVSSESIYSTQQTSDITESGVSQKNSSAFSSSTVTIGSENEVSSESVNKKDDTASSESVYDVSSVNSQNENWVGPY